MKYDAAIENLRRTKKAIKESKRRITELTKSDGSLIIQLWDIGSIVQEFYVKLYDAGTD